MSTSELRNVASQSAWAFQVALKKDQAHTTEKGLGHRLNAAVEMYMVGLFWVDWIVTLFAIHKLSVSKIL